MRSSTRRSWKVYARLSLKAEPAGRFDLLILDAFSSDSPPVHLLTVEAVQDEIRTVKSSGLLASRDAATIALLRVRGWTDARAADHPFSDDYSDLIRYLRLTN